MEEQQLITDFVVDNHFYIYGSLNESTILEVIKPMKKLIEKCKYDEVNMGIHLHVNSPGGDISVLYGLMALIKECKNNKIHVSTYAEGECVSCAALLVILGNTRYAHEFSSLMFHYPSGNIYSNNIEMLEREAAQMKNTMNVFADIIEKHTSMTNISVEMVSDSFYIMGKDLLTKGCVDIII